MQRRHRVGPVREPERQDRHAERLVGVLRLDPAKGQEVLPVHAERVAQGPEVLVDQGWGKVVVARRHGCVRREHDLWSDTPDGFRGIDPFGCHPMAHELNRRKSAVAFVEVQDAGRNAQRSQRPDAAHAEQQFLANTDTLVTTVEARGQLAIFGLIAVHVRVEQKQRIASDRQLPHASADSAGARFDRHHQRLAVAHRRAEGKQVRVDGDVILVLPAAQVQPLTEVSLAVVQTHAHEGHAQIGRALDVIAGQDAQAARVDGQRFVEAELGGEVRNRPGPQHAGVAGAPGVLRVQVLLHPPVGVVDSTVQSERRGALFQLVDRNPSEQRHWIVVDFAPQRGVQFAEEARGVRVPAPPQVLGEGAQSLMCRGDELAERPCLADDRSELAPRHDQHPDIVGAEHARIERLDDEYPLEQAAIDDRHAEKGAIGIFARFLKVLEARMQRGVGEYLRLECFGHEAGEAFAEAHPHAADALRAEADGGRKDQVRPIRLQQVDRADIGFEPLPDEMDDVGQRLRGVAALGNEPADFLERPQQRAFLRRHQVADVQGVASRAGNDACVRISAARSLPCTSIIIPA